MAFYKAIRMDEDAFQVAGIPYITDDPAYPVTLYDAIRISRIQADMIDYKIDGRSVIAFDRIKIVGL